VKAEIAKAVERLKEGRLVAFPTETVYGLGADASNAQAVARLYAVKRRPADHPVIVHFDAADRAFTWAREVPEAARTLAKRFWPGPLTLILKRSAKQLLKRRPTRRGTRAGSSATMRRARRRGSCRHMSSIARSCG